MVGRLARVVVLTTLLFPILVRAEKTDAQKRDEARQHYSTGLKYYNLGDFDRAVTEYKAAYELTSAPGLLFNIGQAYRLKKDYDQAVFFYRSYLRAQPEAANRADVEQLITETEQQADKARGTLPKIEPKIEPKTEPKIEPKIEPKTEPKTEPKIEPKIEPKTEPKTEPKLAPHLDEHPRQIEAPPIADEPRHPGKSYKIAGIATLGAGAVLVAVTAYLLISDASASDNLTTMSQQNAVWTADDQHLWDRSESWDKLAVGTAILGGVGVVGGVILYYVGARRDRAAERHVTFAPTQGGAAIGFSCAF